MTHPPRPRCLLWLFALSCALVARCTTVQQVAPADAAPCDCGCPPAGDAPGAPPSDTADAAPCDCGTDAAATFDALTPVDASPDDGARAAPDLTDGDAAASADGLPGADAGPDAVASDGGAARDGAAELPPGSGDATAEDGQRDLGDAADSPGPPDAAPADAAPGDTAQSADPGEVGPASDLGPAGDAPDTPDTPEIPDTPDTPDTPEIPDTPDTPDTPGADGDGVALADAMPDTPDPPDAADTGDTPPQPFVARFRLPVDYAWGALRYSDSFGPRILSGVYDFHQGIDIVLELGEPIFAADAGYVVFAGTSPNHPRAGLFIVVEHADGLQTGYLHLSALADGIEAGAPVASGELVGFAGMSGENITRVHLHFSVFVPHEPGALPSFPNDSVPPLTYLDYDDTPNHTVAVDLSEALDPAAATVEIHVEVPGREIDLDDVHLRIHRADDTPIYDQRVRFSDRTNCGTDEPEVNGIEIVPEDFMPPDPSYSYDFRFKNIDLSAEIGLPLRFEARATDIRGNVQTATRVVVVEPQ